MDIGLHNLKPPHGSRKNYKRTGRGNAGKGGTTAGRGTKGQKSRSGVSGLKRLGMKRIMLAMPKLGGFRGLQIRPATVQLTALAASFPQGGEITIKSLKAHHLVHRETARVKLIGSAKLQKAYMVKGIAASAGAKASIEAAGGSLQLSSRPPMLSSRPSEARGGISQKSS